MKRLPAIIIAWLLAVLPLAAQESGPKNLFHVKAGGNYSNVYGGPKWAQGYPGRFGFIGGVEYERVMGRWGLSAGAMFSMQGKKSGLYSDGNNMVVMPLMANCYFYGNRLIAHLGFQPGFSKKYDSWITDLSIPVGLSYRYKRFTFDVIYKIGFYTKADEDMYVATPYPGYVPEPYSRGHSGVLSLMVGYNFFAW